MTAKKRKGEKKMNKTITFDPMDFESIKKIMDEHGDSNMMYPGINANGEETWISPYVNRVVVTTFQENGWTRVNTYWRDGTREETFDGKWR